MTIAFTGLPTAEVAAIRASGRDAYDNPIEHQVSDGVGVPCRHCLQQVPKGQGYLILAHRPFESRNPYAETGPIFLCADDCAPAVPGPDLPPMLASAQYIVRGYSAAERIVTAPVRLCRPVVSPKPPRRFCRGRISPSSTCAVRPTTATSAGSWQTEASITATRSGEDGSGRSR
jgi:hypothetical protein